MSSRCVNSVQSRCAAAEVLTVAEYDCATCPNYRERTDVAAAALCCHGACAAMNRLATDAYADSILQRVGGFVMGQVSPVKID